MRNRKFFGRVINFAAAVMVLVCNFVFTACDNSYYGLDEDERTETKEKNEIPTPQPGEEWTLDRDSVNTGHEYTFSILGEEKTSGATAVSRGWASMSENDKYNILEQHRNLDVKYANASKVFGKPEVSFGRGEISVKSLATFNLEDGNVVKVSSTIGHAMAKVNGEYRMFPCDSLVNVELLSLDNVEAPARTRGAMYVSDSVYTEIKAELTYVTVGLKQNYQYKQVICDTITRYILSEDEIDSAYVSNKRREVLDASTERCYFDEVFVMKSGEEKVSPRERVLQYGVSAIPTYEKQVVDFGYALVSTNGVVKGESEYNRTESEWTINREVDSYSSNLNNAASELVKTSYTLYHESAVYADEWVTVEFPMIDITVNEGKTNVTPITSTRGDWYEMARLDNSIVANYQGYTQGCDESVILFKEAKRVIFEGWDAETAVKTITLFNVHTSVDYVVAFSDGTEDRKTYENDFAWSFGPKSNWSVTSDNKSYYTGDVNASVDGSQKTATKQGVKYTWNANNHKVTAVVSVAGTNQLDEWNGATVNDITVEKNGNVYSFGHDDYTMTDNGTSLKVANSTETEDVYNYTHAIVFGFGGVTTEAVVPGQIIVAKDVVTFFPKEWGALTAVKQLVSNNETRDGYCYTWSLHFANNVVMPVVVRRGASQPEFNFDWAENTSDSRLNGGAYMRSLKKFINVIGSDTPDMLQYSTADGHNADNQSYVKAKNMNWDEGHLVDGHASVTTNRFSFSINNGVFSATDTYTGTNLGSWTYSK